MQSEALSKVIKGMDLVAKILHLLQLTISIGETEDSILIVSPVHPSNIAILTFPLMLNTVLEQEKALS